MKIEVKEKALIRGLTTISILPHNFKNVKKKLHLIRHLR